MTQYWETHSGPFLALLCSIFCDDSAIMGQIMPSCKTEDGRVKLSAISGPCNGHPSLINLICGVLGEKIDWDAEVQRASTQKSSRIDSCAAGCQIVSFIDTADMRLQDNLIQVFLDASQTYLEMCRQQKIVLEGGVIHGESHHILGCFLGATLDCITKVSTDCNTLAPLNTLVLELLVCVDSNPKLLSGISQYYSVFKDQGKSGILELPHLEAMYKTCQSYLCFPDHRVRLAALEILVSFEQAMFKIVPDCIYRGKCNIFDLLLELETTANSLDSSRGKTIVVRKLETIFASKCLPPLYEDAVIRYLLGKFS